MILLDYSSVAMSTVMTQLGVIDDDPSMIRHMIFNIVRKWNLQFREEYGEMVICMDSAKNWRRDTFPNYKANRRQGRKDSVHDWDSIFELLNIVRDEIIEYTPFRVVRVEGCEADDVIGTICHRFNRPEPILIISPDTDFVQLQKFPNVKQYSNLQKKWVEPKISALADLEEKVLAGDTGDGVPNVMSDDDTLITEGKRQTPLNKRKKEMLKADPEALGTTVARRIIRNRNMIDLSRTPEHLQEEIMSQFNQKAKGSVTRLMTLFTKNRMNLLMESLPDYEVKKLINNNVITNFT